MRWLTSVNTPDALKRILVLSIVASSLVSVFTTLAVTSLVRARPAHAQTSPSVVTAQRFAVQDADGNVRAALGFDAAGRPGLTLSSLDGVDRAQLRMESGQPAFYLLDPDGTRRVALVINPSGDSDVLLRRPGAGPGEVMGAPVSLRLAVRGSGPTSIDILDPDAKPGTPPVWTAP